MTSFGVIEMQQLIQFRIVSFIYLKISRLNNYHNLNNIANSKFPKVIYHFE